MAQPGTKFWRGKVAIVTGGSAGLGLEIARTLVQAGAKVGIIARDSVRNQTVIRNLGESMAHSATADVCNESEALEAIRKLHSHFGRLDCLVNNVGLSTRQDLRLATATDFQESFRINVVSAVNCTRAAREYLERSGGTVVNIASLAGKSAWPYVGPYSVSKSALVTYTQQLRLENPGAIRTLLVCPGPIRRDDEGQRYHLESAGLPSPAARPGAGVRLRGLDPKVLSRKIVFAVERGKLELVVPSSARLAFAIAQLSPRLGDWLLKRFGAASSRPGISQAETTVKAESGNTIL